MLGHTTETTRGVTLEGTADAVILHLDWMTVVLDDGVIVAGTLPKAAWGIRRGDRVCFVADIPGGQHDAKHVKFKRPRKFERIVMPWED